MHALLHHHAACGCGGHELLAPRFPRLTAPSFAPTPPPPPRLVVPTIADTLIVGRIRTMNTAQPHAEAVAISDGRITAVGSRGELAGLSGPDTTVIETGDGIAYPGFVDPHMHYWASAFFYDWVDCGTRDGRTHAQVLDALAAAKPVRGDWVLGTQYDPSLVSDHVELTIDDLDRVQPDLPTMVLNASMHWAYCNSKALELAGITADTLAPPGGIIGKVDGKLTGAIGELAAMTTLFAPIPQPSQEHLTKNLIAINRHAATRGVTHCHDAATAAMVGIGEIDLLHSIASQLETRVTYAIIDSAMDDAIAAGVKPMQGDDMVRAVSWKIVSDGSNQGYSGYQVDNYLGKDFRGHPNFGTDYLVERMGLAADHGWQMMIHANGDAAIAQTIEAYRGAFGGRDRASTTDLRCRIEHCSFPTAANLVDMAELGLTPSFLMGHVYYWGTAFRDDIMGPEKAARLDPLRSAAELGLHPTMHSDYTVTDIEPLRCIQTAVERRMRVSGDLLAPDERVDVATAIAAVTANAAWQTHTDADTGTLAVGKLADVVILDADPAEVDVSDIAATTVRSTIVGGSTVFEG